MRCLLVIASTLLACGRVGFAPLGDGPDAQNAQDAASIAASCSELHLNQPSFPDGAYEIDLDGAGPGPARRLYCDMTTAGGGWTLTGRSTTGGVAGTFGWSGATGTVDDDTAPYSLGSDSGSLVFTELLVGSHAGTKVVADNAYVVPAAADFMVAYAQMSLRSESTTVVGSCVPSPFVTMLLFKGQTDLPGVFWFRDSEFVGGTPHGLFAGGWDTFYPGDCMRGGLLHGTQGVIFVR